MKMYFLYFILFNKIQLEFETTEVTRITNQGNSRANYKWSSQNENKIFSVKPSLGFVEANSYQDCIVTYSPNF